MKHWRESPELRDVERFYTEDGQLRKNIDYYDEYVNPFLECDPLKDWESFQRCKKLWDFCESKIGSFNPDSLILDCGTKDGQFPEWLKQQEYDAIGIEISRSYINYAVSKSRPVEYGDVCCLDYDDETFDVVFSHHLLGLVYDYHVAMNEMVRVLKKGGYFITLNGVPGNYKKHYNVIESISVYNSWLKEPPLNSLSVIYYGHNPYQENKNTKEKEIILFMEKK